MRGTNVNCRVSKERRNTHLQRYRCTQDCANGKFLTRHVIKKRLPVESGRTTNARTNKDAFPIISVQFTLRCSVRSQTSAHQKSKHAVPILMPPPSHTTISAVPLTAIEKMFDEGGETFILKFLSYWTPRMLFTFSLLNFRINNIVQFYSRRAWNPRCLLSEWFPDVDAALLHLHQTNSAIIGPSVLDSSTE